MARGSGSDGDKSVADVEEDKDYDSSDEEDEEDDTPPSTWRSHQGFSDASQDPAQPSRPGRSSSIAEPSASEVINSRQSLPGVSRLGVPKLALSGSGPKTFTPAKVPPLSLGSNQRLPMSREQPGPSSPPLTHRPDSDEQAKDLAGASQPSSTGAATDTAGHDCLFLMPFHSGASSAFQSSSSSSAVQLAAGQLGVAASELQLYALTPVAENSHPTANSKLAVLVTSSGKPQHHLVLYFLQNVDSVITCPQTCPDAWFLLIIGFRRGPRPVSNSILLCVEC